MYLYRPQYSMMSENDSWEYRKLYANQAGLADALGDNNGVALRLATELVAKKVVGKAVKDEADIRGPHVTEIMRVNPIIRAVLVQIKLDVTVYEDFRAALLSPVVDVKERLVNKWVPAHYCCGRDAEVTGDIFKFKDEGGCDVGVVKILEPLSPQLNYYECEIVSRGARCKIGVGAGEQEYPLDRQPGWNRNGIGYHADDGRLFHEDGPRQGKAFGPTCTEGDRMGCGAVFDAVCDQPGYVNIFFTKNGKQVGDLVRMRLPTNGLYPLIGLHSRGEKVHYLGHRQRTPGGN